MKALLVLLVVVLVVPAAASAAAPAPPSVMTQNLYLGADLSSVVQAVTAFAQNQSPGNFVALTRAAANTFRAVDRTDFAARARALAKEIDDSDPYLVGLQEVALWRTGAFADPAQETSVRYDFLTLVLNALAARGLHYAPVSVEQESDFGNVPVGQADDGTLYHVDGRLTDRDVILARTDLPRSVFSTSNAMGANYTSRLVLGVIPQIHGWASVDALLPGHRALRFVTTHLEPFSEATRVAETAELLTGPALATSTPVVLAGDLNSDPNDPGGAGAYNALVAAGFGDSGNASPTCCHDPDLLANDPLTGDFTKRIDHILTRPGLNGLLSTALVGADPADRVASVFGDLLWPSDHAGLRAGLG